jgi:beta-aspartyl-peptidase (threonine type)
MHVAGCKAAAAAGAAVLRAGGTALDAVQQAVIALEDDACFNAGTGTCLNIDGDIELDAAIMEGTTLRAGAVCALPPFKNPIAIARAVLDDATHVLYAAAGAERFALAKGFVRTTREAMTTPLAAARWEAARDARRGPPSPGGTVGAVARDAHGHVAAATSTGGRTFKAAGRVGDSPILGAGTYADDDSGACSNTGDGEPVLRLCLAKTAIEWLRTGMHPEEAARAAVRWLAERGRGEGGTILVDRFGRLGLARSTRSMTWAATTEGMSEVVGGS